VTLSIFFLVEFVVLVVFSYHVPKKSKENVVNQTYISLNDTESHIMSTNFTGPPNFHNCSMGLPLGNNVRIHVCWYKNEVVVDVRKFIGNKPLRLGIGLKKENWYELVHRMKNISNFVLEIDFNHTIFDYTTWFIY
jgi:hypothetical protein